MATASFLSTLNVSTCYQETRIEYNALRLQSPAPWSGSRFLTDRNGVNVGWLTVSGFSPLL